MSHILSVVSKYPYLLWRVYVIGRLPLGCIVTARERSCNIDQPAKVRTTPDFVGEGHNYYIYKNEFMFITCFLCQVYKSLQV